MPRGRLVSHLDISSWPMQNNEKWKAPTPAELVMKGSLTAVQQNTTTVSQKPCAASQPVASHCKSRAGTCCGWSALQELHQHGHIHGVCAAMMKHFTYLGMAPWEQGPDWHGAFAEVDERRQKETRFLHRDMPCNPRKGMTSLQTQYPQVYLIQG